MGKAVVLLQSAYMIIIAVAQQTPYFHATAACNNVCEVQTGLVWPAGSEHTIGLDHSQPETTTLDLHISPSRQEVMS